MITCTKCGREKTEDDFRWKNKAKGIRQCWCKECCKTHEKQVWKDSPERRASNHSHGTDRRHRNAQYVWDYLTTHPCTCGEADPIVLEFDHRDQDTKVASISDMSRQMLSLETIIAEIDKCDVLCANCHRRRTATQCGWYKYLIV